MHPEAGVMSEFCESPSIDEVTTHEYVLTPDRYVGAAPLEDDGEPIEEKLTRTGPLLLAEFDETDHLDQLISERYKGLIRD
jgi:type I restriction enzyme M protein